MHHQYRNNLKLYKGLITVKQQLGFQYLNPHFCAQCRTAGSATTASCMHLGSRLIRRDKEKLYLSPQLLPWLLWVSSDILLFWKVKRWSTLGSVLGLRWMLRVQWMVVHKIRLQSTCTACSNSPSALLYVPEAMCFSLCTSNISLQTSRGAALTVYFEVQWHSERLSALGHYHEYLHGNFSVCNNLMWTAGIDSYNLADMGMRGLMHPFDKILF